MKYPQPANDEAFEEFSLHLLRKLWNSKQVDRYGRRGQRQYGVDIVDLSGVAPFRAAQCKQHSGDIELDPVEIRAEVKKAKAFPTQIDIYYFLTTAKKSTRSQNELLKINRRHRAQSLFTVELLTWESIERLLDDYSELQEYLVSAPLSSVSRALAQHTETITARIATVREDIAVGQGQNQIERELGEARAALDRHDHQLARLLLSRVQAQHWDRATPRQRFRVLVNTGAAHLSSESFEEAARCFLRAEREYPEDDRAPSLAAQAYELLGDPSKAFDLATAALLASPVSCKAAAVRVRTAPAELTWDTLVASIPSGAIDGEVTVAFALRALGQRRFDLAEQQAIISTTKSPDWPIAWLILGNVLVMREVSKFSDRDIQDRLLDRGKLKDAERILGTAIELARSTATPSAEADALLLRSKARDMLGQTQEASDDAESAYLLSPHRPDILFARAGYLQHTGDLTGAIRCLRLAIAKGAGGTATYVLVTLLYASGDREHRREATELCRRLVQDEGAPYQDDAVLCVIRELISDGATEEADSFLRQLTPLVVPACANLLSAVVAHGKGGVADAERLAKQAAAAIDSSTSISVCRGVARLLTALGKYEEALPLLQRVVVPGMDTPDLYQYIAVADRLGRLDLVLKEYDELRVAGIYNRELFQNEVSILERLAPERAIDRIQTHLLTAPGDKFSVVRLSIIGLRLGRPEIVVSEPSSLPSVTEADPEWLGPIVHIMRSGGRHAEAAAFAYHALRRSFASPEAHKAFVQAIMPSTGLDIETRSESVTSSSAVRYVEEGKDQDAWLVIEDGVECDPSRGETSVAGSVARRLLGKKVGDRVQLTDGAVEERFANIKEIVHKYVYRIRDVMENWQIRFPDDSFVQSVRLETREDGSGTAVDLSAILKVVDERHNATERVLQAYESSPLPIHAVAAALNLDDLSMTIELAERDGVSIRTYWGPGDRYQRDSESALAELGASLSPVMDTTALASIVQLGLEKELGASPKWAKATQSVMDHLSRWATRWEDPALVGTLGRRGDQYVREAISDGERQREVGRRKECAAKIRKALEVVGVLELAGIDFSIRESCEPLVGTGGLEAMVKGSQPGFVLWTDDFVVAAIARERFGAHTVGTELVLRHWKEIGRIDASVYHEASAKMIAWRYSPIPLSAESYRAAGEQAQWKPEGFPLAGNLDVFATDALDLKGVLILLARMIPTAFRSLDSSNGRTLFLEAILLRLAARPDGSEVVRVLLGVLERAFGLDVTGYLQAAKYCETWLRLREGESPLAIHPVAEDDALSG